MSLQSKNESKEASASENTLSVWKKFQRMHDKWYKQQSRTRLIIFYTTGLFGAAMFGVLTWLLSHPPHQLALSDCIDFGLGCIAFMIFWPLLTLRWKCFSCGGRKVQMPKLLSWWTLTIWLSLFVATANASQTTSSTNNIPAIQQQADGAISSTNVHTNVTPAINCYAWIFVLIIGAILFAMFVYLLCSIGWCGSTGAEPPQSSAGSSGGANSISHMNIRAAINNTNLSLPVTIFYLSDGIVVSNSAGLGAGSLPPMLASSNASLTNGSQISATAPGISTPPTIALWVETNTFYDANLDLVYPYIAVFNYSLLTTTNLTAGWQEVCTVVGWVNMNPSVPLISSITYTNGVPETTNWTQIYLNTSKQPTNIVVYGNLPTWNTNSTFTFNAVRPHDAPIPPGGGGGSGTNAVFNSSAQFFRLTCNTNSIVTSWP